MLAEKFRVFGGLDPARTAAEGDLARALFATVAHAKQQRSLRAVDVFVQLARRMHDESTRHDVDRALRGAHFAAALKTEIHFRRFRMTVIGADLSGFPAGDRDVAPPHLAEHFLDMALHIPFSFLLQIENAHCFLL